MKLKVFNDKDYLCIKVRKYKAIEKQIAKALQKQVLEPLEALCIVEDKRREISNYLRFENGEPISRGNPTFSKLSEGDGNQGECDVQSLTPGKCIY